MKRLLLVALALPFLQSDAAVYELGLGVSHANPADCGIWYDCAPGTPHALALNHLSWSAGLAGRNWRAGYENLGTFGSVATWPTSADPTLWDGHCVPGCYPISHYQGDGFVHGVYAEYVLHAGPWSVEAGPWIYRATWNERSVDVHPTAGTTCSNAFRTGKNAVGAMAGIGYQAGAYTVSATVRSANNRDVAPDGGLIQSVIKGVVTNISIRRSF